MVHLHTSTRHFLMTWTVMAMHRSFSLQDEKEKTTAEETKDDENSSHRTQDITEGHKSSLFDLEII